MSDALKIITNAVDFRKQMQRQVRKLQAIRVTVNNHGVGEVVVSKRTPKLPHERGTKRRPMRDPTIPVGVFARRVGWVTGANGARQRDTHLRSPSGHIMYEVVPISTPAHGRVIANAMRAKGHDPFAYPPEVVRFANRLVEQFVWRAERMAYGASHKQDRIIHQGLTAAAQYLADWARQNIIEGGLGQKKPMRVAMTQQLEGVSSADQPRAGRRTVESRRRQKQTNMVRRGYWTADYGVPPPYGIATGRFVGNGSTYKGIRGRWRRGRQF